MNGERKTYNLWTDGSYNPAEDMYGGGFLIEEIRYKGLFSSRDALRMSKHIAGECCALINGLDAISQLDTHARVIIHHDYTGLAEWYHGTWMAKSPVAKYYLASLARFTDMQLIFHKVQAHSGVILNEKVDKLAKVAVNILDPELVEDNNGFWD